MRGFPKLNLKILQNLQIKVQSKQVKRALKLSYNTANILFQELLPAGFTTDRQQTRLDRPKPGKGGLWIL